MSGLKLVLGNANYSSWSMRADLVMQASGLDYEREFIPIFSDDFKKKLQAYHPVGTVPILVGEEITIIDTLAIAEWAAEQNPSLWPSDQSKRAKARELCAIMHSGFVNLRSECSVNIRRKPAMVSISDAVRSEISLICQLWRSTLETSGGPFLFGEWSIADAFYTPVASRFATYDFKLDSVCSTYANRLLDTEGFQNWKEIALREEWIIDIMER